MGTSCLGSVAAVSRVFGYIRDAFAVDLNGAGAVEADGDLVAFDGFHILCVSYMRSFENLREDGYDSRAGEVVCDEEGDLAVLAESVLMGSDLHTAAEVASVCNGSEPDTLVFLCNAVDRDGGVVPYLSRENKGMT